VKKNSAKLTSGPVGKSLINMTGPMIIGIVSIIAFNLIDTFFVGQLGTVELAAMSFTFPVIFVIGSIALGLGVGASSVISRAIGEGNYHKVQRFTTDALTLSLLIVTFFVVIGIFTIDPLFRLLGATEKTLPLIRDYMMIWYPGVTFVIIPMVGNSAIRATGDTKTPSLIMVISASVNLILDPLFIFGIGSFHGWGLKGAATATVFARAVSMIFSVLILKFREKMITFEIPSFKTGIESWKKILYIGLPAAGTNMIIPFSMGIITRFVSVFGVEAVAALGVATRIESFSLTVIMALSSVIIPFVGQNFGAKNIRRIKKGVILSQRFAFFWGLLLSLLFFIFGLKIAEIFNSNALVIKDIRLYLLIVSSSYSFLGVLMISGSTFNGVNRPFPSAVLSLLRMVFLYVPLAYILSGFFGLSGIFIAAAVSNLIAGSLAFIWLKSDLKKIKIF